MLTISEDKINKYKQIKCIVYSKQPLSEGCECFASSKDLKKSSYYMNTVNIYNIKHDNGKFYYTNEDLSSVCDFWSADMLPIIGAFKKKGKLNKSYITDISGLPAFTLGATNEDAKICEYRLYITLFDDYSLKQCQYERHNLFDAKFKSSKYDLESKLQNSEFLKSKDFAVINVRRKDEESVCIGLIIREPDADTYQYDYGKVLINMQNKITIKWH